MAAEEALEAAKARLEMANDEANPTVRLESALENFLKTGAPVEVVQKMVEAATAIEAKRRAAFRETSARDNELQTALSKYTKAGGTLDGAYRLVKGQIDDNIPF